MCGIVGFFSRKSWLSEGDLIRMIGSVAHRGPDARGAFLEDSAGLGHRRLSIIDLSEAANQPMHSHCGRYVMVYNGEIYNFREILEEIRKEQPDFVPRTSSDSEVVLQAFALWGKAFTSRLNGMFAIAIYDRQAHKLYLFRDRMGIKPLYYFYDGEHFAFASELKGLLAVTEIRQRLSLNRQAVALFLHLGYIPSPISIFKEVKKFPSGNLATVDKDGISIAPWWQASSKVESSVIFDPGEALERFEHLLESSVQYRLISDVPYGAFLSGGIDSSLVTAMAQKVNSGPLSTFTIGFPETKYNEADFARTIAAHLGTQHNEFTVTEQEALDWLPTYFDTYDEPFADSSGIPSLLVAHLARQKVTMILTGDGGDELFMGYGAYKWAERLGSNYPLFLRNAAAGLLEKGNLRSKRAAMLFRYPDMDHFKSHIFSQEQYFFSGNEVEDLLLEVEDLPAMQESFPSLLRELRPAEQQALFDLHYYLPDDLLVKVDRATMAQGLEARVPLLDYRIVEFALNLDYKLKVKNGQTKWLMRQLLKKFVPSELFERPKWGFSIPLLKWLQNDLKFLADEHLSEEAVKRTGVLNPEEVKKLLHAFYGQGKTYLYQRVWALIVLQRWLENNPLKKNIT
ncbi:MAG: asparagine synthase (glutamine-hydrolyzing) [Bacteroidales bacterium]|jgi:asparagine synthase (glutamine-hydrolysing)|nr:asparagine synthase (glutamine-hydrolyzing) [Bacteroidales bacterium]NLM91357.1 asparagine synthase (glutamine-hydrolyzing) [Bacteroidales bacterium]